MKVGILALQGAFTAHGEILSSLGAAPIEVRSPTQLEEVDRLIIPGGESTTMSKLAVTYGLIEPLGEFLRAGRPVFGTCAGAIFLSNQIEDGRDDQRCLNGIDISVRRNAFGTQRESFEIDLEIPAIGNDPFHAVFIRAPEIAEMGEHVEVLADVDGSPALVRSGEVLVSTFHPELSGDARLHELFLEQQT